ncbi:MAG: DUF2520 domain-containing protein [Actinobacteria bacterium]|nr:DUF2520 domain-containing protein [Actinomycetota bacterium]
MGTTLAVILASKNLPGLKLKSIASKTRSALTRAKKLLGGTGSKIFFSIDNALAAKGCNIILICTPDDSIEEVCKQIVSSIDTSGAASQNYGRLLFIHFSGSKSLKILNSAQKAGCSTASIHPLKSFASIENSIKTLKNTIFGFTYSDEISKKTGLYIIKTLGGRALEVNDDKKPLYHAAACVASNYLVSLINYAVKIYRCIGIKGKDSLAGMIALSEGTLENIKNMGTKKSLTGPIARGDTGTIEEHMANFYKYCKNEDIFLYKVLGKETGKIAYENNWISKDILSMFNQLFEIGQKGKPKKKD